MSNYRSNENYRYNNYPYADAQYGPYPIQQAQPGLLAQISDFARRQPILAMAGAVVGGLLLARYLTNQSGSSQSYGQVTGGYQGAGNSYRPMWSYAPVRPNPAYRPQTAQPQRPADHMGATEDQMSNDFADPSRRELEQGAKGTTGTVYDLDPDSITAG